MLRKLHGTALLLLLLFRLSSLQAQDAADTTLEVSAEFLAQLENFMTANKQKANEDAYRDFEKSFKGGMFAEEESADIQRAMNLMRDHRLTASPFFQEYMAALGQAKNSVDGQQRFHEWHGLLNTMLADDAAFKANNFLHFLRFSRHFFEQQALRFSPASTSWFITSPTVKWAYEKGIPAAHFEAADLLATRNDDTLSIRKTSGIYYPTEDKWKGKGGVVTWEHIGLKDVYAELDDYDLDTKSSLYEVASARLHYPLYFGNKLVPGYFSDKLVSAEIAGSYPKFESRDSYIDISNVGDGIKMKGGFRLQGETVHATGNAEQPAEILLLDKEKKPLFRGLAESFTIRREERVVGERVRAVLYMRKDSLFHPSVNMRLEIPRREIQLTRGERGSDRNPFYNSLQKMSLAADYVNIYLDEDSLVVGKPTLSFSHKDDVAFESLEFFRLADYQRIQNIASVNPLEIMKATAEREGTRFIDADKLASRINSKFTVDNIQTLLYDLVSNGFIDYNADKKLIHVKDKVIHYVDANAKRTDYDLLRIVSSTDSINATTNTRNGFTMVDGVSQVSFSPFQRVAAKPQGSQIELRADRNLDFDGLIYAGYSTIEGKEFHFEYEPFHIRLDSVRYFDLFVPTGKLDENNQPIALSIGSRIEHVNGVLLIDAPNNKSGKEDIFMFPSFQSKSSSFVFYDRDSTQQKAYSRDSFYFELKPFSFDHLDKFGPQDLKFEGKLVSAGIFPDIKETLVLQEDDQSLGFNTKTSDEGYGAYGKKGVYKGGLTLNNYGLSGQGNLDYLGASINSVDYIFKPKQTLASADRFDMEEERAKKPERPQVRGENVKIDWRPYQDSMYVSSDKAPFKMYKADDHQLTGTLILTPGGLKGRGELDWDQAIMQSDMFAFGAFSAQADTSSIRIKSLEDDERLALETHDVNGIVDFDKQKGTFKANDEYLETALPYNQYVTSMNEFDWDMKGESIVFQAKLEKPGIFTSIHPDQDSLKFSGQSARYDLKTSMLAIKGVPHIHAADAFIYPDSQFVEIGPNAVMTTLENARIVADTTNKHHVINRATVKIKGRRAYEASGFYEYNVGPHEQEFELQNIVGQPVGKGSHSEKQSVTRATGEVAEKDSFYIDHKTLFQGTISLNAESKNLMFNGFARLNADKLPNSRWFTVSSEGDKNDLAIRFDVPKSAEGELLETGLFLSRETSRIYPRVMMPLHFRKDRPVLRVTGVFKYDEKTDDFIFGDSTKVMANDLKGNKLVFKNKDAGVEVEGRFELGSALKYIKVDAAGRASTVMPPPTPEEEAAAKEEEAEDPNIMLADDPNLMMPADDSLSADSLQADLPPFAQPAQPAIPVTAELMAGFQFIVPEPLLKVIQNDFKSATFDAKVINYLGDIDFYRKTVHELFPAGKERQDGMDGLAMGFLDLPKKVNPYTFLFSQIKMKWDPDYQSFVSTDKNIGLVSIDGESVNKVVEAYVEVKMPTTTTEGNEDDRVYVYLKSPSGLYYFFGFKQGILSITSNNTIFMEELGKLKAKDLVLKMDDGETYEIQSVEMSTANVFVRRVEAVGK